MKKIFGVVVGLVIICSHASAQTTDEKKVAAAVEHLRQAMIDGNQSELESLVSDHLTYGHSGGHIDDKKEFVEKLVSGRSDFVTMDLTDQSIYVSGKTAIVRHMLSAKTNDSGKPGEVHLQILLVWQKLHGRWILLARQAVKPT